MAIANEINRVQYIAEDFQTYRDEATQFFKTQYPEQFNNLIATDLGNALMDQIAFAMMSLSFMVNRRASELFLSTARLNSSITKLARMLGYSISPGAPATTDLTITLSKGPYAFPVTIPVGFAFQGPGDTVYQYSGAFDFVIAPGQTSVSIPIKEGQTRRLSFVSDGTPNQQFNVLGIPSGQFIYSDGMILSVDGNAWSRQDLIKYSPSNVYEVLFTESPAKLRFGDGIAGNIPPLSSQIALVFRYGKGSSGSIGQNQISSVVNQLVIHGISIPMTFSNAVSTVGSDPEDIRHVRSYASTFFRTQNAAVVKSDYDTIATLQPGVALADAQIVRGISNDLTIQNQLALIAVGQGVVLQTVNAMAATGVSGQASLEVSGQSALSVAGVSSLGVSGLSNVGVYQGTPATGTITFGSSVSGNDNFSINGVAFTAVSSGAGAQQFNIGASSAITAQNAASAINKSTNTLVSQQVTAAASGSQVSLTSKAFDVFGNTVTLSSAQGSIFVSGNRLSGGLAPSVTGVSGLSQVGVSGVPNLQVSGTGSLGVMGLDSLGVSGQSLLLRSAVSGTQLISSAVSGLSDYLSQTLSDTSSSNHIQVILLSADSNNRYISPSSTVLDNVQSAIKSISDAVVTVNVLDGYYRVVNADVTVEIGISQTAVASDIKTQSLNALTSSISPFGLLVRRNAGVSLYVSDIEDAIRAASSTGDIRFINVTINGPIEYLDSAGNLIISRQQIIQNGTVSVNVTKRFLTSGDIVNVASR
jgi:hypothetical protein